MSDKRDSTNHATELLKTLLEDVISGRVDIRGYTLVADTEDVTDKVYDRHATTKLTGHETITLHVYRAV